MRISLEWLSQYVDIKGLTPEGISEALTNSGLEVEEIETVGAKFSSVVVAKCEKLDPHPNADKLRLATVNRGNGQTQQVVCGAPNLAEGMLIAFGLEGAVVLNRKDGSTFTLGNAVIRGVESCGMVCSLDELGLTETYADEVGEGIWDVKQHATDADLGKPLETVLGLASDTVLHTAPTANRGDQMSVIGVAREVAALFNRELTLPEIKTYSAESPASLPSVKLSDTTLCPYYAGAVMTTMKTAPSPDWMARRLEAMGVKVINNVVDITNYVLMEMGQPLHSFDGDKLGLSGTVGVRFAKADEKITTLDAEERTLTEEAVLITKDDKPVALAGVMGGASTEIDIETGASTLFLEAAIFHAASNRKSAKSVGLRTEASARFERGIDEGSTFTALCRAIDLYKELTGAELVGITESARPTYESKHIEFRLSRFEKMIGLSLDASEVTAILGKLGFGVETKSDDVLLVSVPSHRAVDVTREIDVIEEVVRIHGYDNIPYTLPKKATSSPVTARERVLTKLRNAVQGMGLQEVMTTSLIGPSLLEKTGFPLDEKQTVSVINSHSRDHTLMRQSLMPNLLEVAKFNQANGVDDVWVFETGRTYHQMGKPSVKHSGVSEKLRLGILMTGNAQSGDWHADVKATQAPDFYRVKGMVENVLHAVGLSDFAFTAQTEGDDLHPGRTATVAIQQGKKSQGLGVLGELHPVRAKRLKFKKPVYLVELDLEAIIKAVAQHVDTDADYAVSAYPAVTRDMAFSAKQVLSHQEILSVIENQQSDLLRDVLLFDEYTGDQLDEGERSLAYRLTFQSSENTLKDKDVDAVFKSIKEALEKHLPVTFR